MNVNLYETRLNSYGIPVLEIRESYSRVENSISNPEEAYELLEKTVGLSRFAEEHVYVIALNVKNKVKGIFEISHGTDNVSMFPIKETLRSCILCGSSRMIVAHNHPSGDVTPSNEDIAATKNIIEASKIVGVQCLDHMIHGGSAFISMSSEHIGGFE